MKVLVIHFSQSGNTRKIAHAIAEGARTCADEVVVKALKHVTGKDYQGS